MSSVSNLIQLKNSSSTNQEYTYYNTQQYDTKRFRKEYIKSYMKLLSNNIKN